MTELNRTHITRQCLSQVERESDMAGAARSTIPFWGKNGNRAYYYGRLTLVLHRESEVCSTVA